MEGPVGDHGVVMDFDQLADIVEEVVVRRYDHRLLNDFLDNPTAELIAADAWKAVEAGGLVVAAIRLWETPDSMVELLA